MTETAAAKDGRAAPALALADTNPDPAAGYGFKERYEDRRRAGEIFDWLRDHGWEIVRSVGRPTEPAKESRKPGGRGYR